MEKIIRFETTKRASKNYKDRTIHIWNLKNQLNIDYVLLHPFFSKFRHAATIVESDCKAGYKIKLEPEFVGKRFIIYIIEKHGKVLKGGKSKNSLDTRSYGAGTEETWTMRFTCSETNYVWSQIFIESIKDGYPIKFYAMVVPSISMSYESFDGEIITEMVSPYESEEKKMNKTLVKMNNGKLIGEGKLLQQHKQ
jgi:hypothetical protein